MNAIAEFPSHDTVPPARMIGPAVAPRSVAEQARRLMLAVTELAELVEADYLDNPDDEGCQLRDLHAREAKDEAIRICQAIAQLPKGEQDQKRALWMVR